MLIELNKLREPKFLLRFVKRGTVEFEELKDSILANGVLCPILVRPVGEFYEVVDGYNRFEAARDLKHKSIPVIVKDLTDDEVLLIQVEMNATVIETDPLEYADRLRLILKRTPGMSQARLAKSINKSVPWVSRMLGLERLTKAAQSRLRRGEMSLSAGMAMSRLPKFLQVEFLESACNLPIEEFQELARVQKKSFYEGVVGNWEPQVAYLRPIHEIKKELKTLENAGYNILLDCAETPMDGWKACLKWVLNIGK